MGRGRDSVVPLPPEHVLLLLARRRARQRRGAHLPGDGWTMERDDCCLGFFMVAACYPLLKDSRTRSRETHLVVAWRA